jgi:hypothetical protein
MSDLNHCRHSWHDVTAELEGLFSLANAARNRYYVCRNCLAIESNLPVRVEDPADRLFPTDPHQTELKYGG